jgi:uncharacterized repeat protein (TIGR02543 family)
MNNKRRHIIISLLTFHFALFIFSACPNPFAPQRGENIPPGKGSFSLSVTVARTILPGTPPEFAAFTLAFSVIGEGTSVSVDRSPANLSEPVYLDTGTYNLVVTAYFDTDKTKLAARGTLDDLLIDEGESLTRTVALKMIADEGEGRFKYTVGFPSDMKTAKIEITPLNTTTGTQEQNRDLVSGTPVTLTLNSGYYNVVITLVKNNDDTLIWRELLHVYASLESEFTKVFTDDDFYNTKYTVTFKFENGDSPGEKSVVHGATISSLAPTRNLAAGLYVGTPPVAYTFVGWFTSGNTEWNFNTDTVTGDIILTAQWTGASPIDYETVAANDVGAAVTYVNSNPTTYTLLLDASSISTGAQSLNANVDLTIMGIGSERTIQATSAPLFTVNNANASLTLGNNITLRGSNISSALVSVSNGTFTMKAGSKITGHTNSGSGSGGVMVSTGGTFEMTGGEISGNKVSTASSGGGVYVDDGGTFNMTGGEISGNTAATTSGGGVYVNGTNASFTMNGGEISGNTASNNSGGVYVNGASFTMKDGKISRNNNSKGVHIQTGTFTMNGGEISNHTSSSGAGVYVNGASFTMNNGKISDNTASAASNYSGGGVYVVSSGIFHMTGGEISGNTASTGGGVNVASGTFKMKGGRITKNNASVGPSGSSTGNGAGVHVSGIFEMENGEIFDNTASNSGGGVFVGNNGTFTMTGGEITGNNEVRVSPSIILFTLSGNANIGVITLMANNTTHASITIADKYEGSATLNLYGSSAIATVIGYWGGKVVIKGETGYTLTESDISKFTLGQFMCSTAADNRSITGNAEESEFDNYYIGTTAADIGKLVNETVAKWNEVDFGPGAFVITNTFNVFNENTWNEAKTAISGGGANKNYIINVIDDFTVAGVTTSATFGNVAGIKVSLRGAGADPVRTLTLSDNGRLIYTGNNQTVILRNLTLQGNSGNTTNLVYVFGTNSAFIMRSGKISGNTSAATNSYGGGVNVTNNGTFTMYGGEISGNTYDNRGGGVYVDGTFTMHGGKISGNISNSNGGGGVYVAGTFTMNGGEISNNETGAYGGGVNVNTNATFTMNGGKISGNTANNSGGGVYVTVGTFTMNGGEISGNKANKNNVPGYGGGGVYITGVGAIFRIVTGTIYGSEDTVTESLRNTAGSGGAALFVNSGTATYGPDGTGTNLATRDNTIEV